MSGMAQVFILGTMGQDPELKYSNSGTAIVNLSVATNRKEGGEQKTDWHRVTYFGKQAEAIAQYMNKGDQIVVSGTLKYGKWTDSNGVERTSTEITGERFSFVNGSRGVEVKAEGSAPETHADDDIPF